MGSRPMTRETRVEWRFVDHLGVATTWQPLDPIQENWTHRSGVQTRKVERYVTEWAPVEEGS